MEINRFEKLWGKESDYTEGLYKSISECTGGAIAYGSIPSLGTNKK